MNESVDNLTEFIPPLEELQEDVLDLLNTSLSLLEETYHSLGLGNTATEANMQYSEFYRNLEEEIQKVSNLELVLAVVAPMKAGKSTIINAIAGQDILPSRNTAMTTLPTQVVFSPEIEETVLELPVQLLEVFQETLGILQKKLQQSEVEQEEMEIEEEVDIRQYPHLSELLGYIRTGECKFLLQSETFGGGKIRQTLIVLNDLIRLCNIVAPLVDPLLKIQDIPRIKTPVLHSQQTEMPAKMGNLVIIDTPGPNEAGTNLQLSGVVESQLKKSSLVLIVLDFTQLKAKAAEDVKKEVQKIIQLRGKNHLYVLINKIDQRMDDDDMTADEVQRFVSAEFDLETAESCSDRVFEVAARWAFCATNFLLESQNYPPDTDVTGLKTTRALAQQALGSRWERKLEKSTLEQLQSEAEYLWKDSGFPHFLEKVVHGLMLEVAPRCLISALTIHRSYLNHCENDVALRRNAIAADAQKLQEQIAELDHDLQKIEACRKSLESDTLTVKKRAQDTLKENLETLKQRNSFMLHSNAAVARFVQTLCRQYRVNIDTNDDVYFDAQSLAERFSAAVASYAKQEAEKVLESVSQDTERVIQRTNQQLVEHLSKKIHPILEQAQERLSQSFQVALLLPQPELDVKHAIDFKHSVITREEKQWNETQRVHVRPWWTLWLVSFPEYRTFRRRVNYYIVSLPTLLSHIDNALCKNIDNIKQALERYLERDFQERIDEFFTSLDQYFVNYRNSLRRAQKDQSLEEAHKNRLVEQFDAMLPEIQRQIKESDTYLEYAQRLMGRRDDFS